MDKNKQPPLMDYEAKAKMIANFVHFCTWPSNRNPKKQGAQLIMGAFEKDDTISFLIEQTKTKIFAGTKIKIVIINDDETIKECNLLFINDSSKKRLKKILEIVADLPILTVADEKGYAKEGVMISMFRTSKKIAFNVNQASLLKSGLILRSAALSLADEIF